MPKDDYQNYRETTPHFDDKRESIINDPTATQGQQMGIKVDSTKEFKQDKNPFHLSQSKPNDDMKEFEKRMRGNKVE
ncbi:hypothetical protein [Pseudalkalibacillus decolorationis]|uniref:hypothetical protein n=1 Tax=Pseudalkalibacillus decolorationis TaxID=163879 RepID=UPI0021478950|nr:hypothetical protein [Pseudalkalibacillus decolorationis]